MVAGAERDALIERYVPLADGLASKWARSHRLDHAETRAIARAALVKAAKTFDPEKSDRFDLYAWRRIKSDMQDEGRKAMLLSRSEFARGERRERPLSLDAFDALIGQLEGSDRLAAAEAKVDLVRALKTLHFREQQIVLWLAAGWSAREIAQAMRLTESSISKIARGARVKILSYLGRL